MRKAAIFLAVGAGALALLLPLSRLVAQDESAAPAQTISETVDTSMPGPRDGANLYVPPPPVGGEVPPKDATPTMLVNTRRIRLNYGVNDVGPSGIAAVELWATRDGKTWQCYSNEPPPTGPLVVHVAEEGRYGFFLVVKSGVGTKSTPPRAGDKPQVWVEVDETAPAVKLHDVQVGKGPEAGHLVVTWAASDPHLADRPITISTAPGKDGPWAPIAKGLVNTGHHAWAMPKDMPYQFYVKVEAADRAGNVGCACTHEPVKVDLARPTGTILGVDHGKKPEPTAETKAAPPGLSTPVTLAR
jgi:hypothetical protein